MYMLKPCAVNTAAMCCKYFANSKISVLGYAVYTATLCCKCCRYMYVMLQFYVRNAAVLCCKKYTD